MAISIYFDYRMHRYDCARDLKTHEHTANSLAEARAYVKALRQHAIDAHVIIDYIEVREAGDTRRVIWAWGEGAH